MVHVLAVNVLESKEGQVLAKGTSGDVAILFCFPSRVATNVLKSTKASVLDVDTTAPCIKYFD